MELYNRMMLKEFAHELLEQKEYIFLYASLGPTEEPEKRGGYLKSQLCPEHYCQIEYLNQGISAEGKIVEGFRITRENGETREFLSLRQKDMQQFLKELFSECQKLVVDFTLMNTRFLGSFCAILGLLSWEEVYFCYTEPGKYNKNENNDYELKNVTMGFDQIPGLETFSDSSAECDWVVFLGFEGSRLMRLEEESPTNRKYSLPYISIPSMQPNWHNVALNVNQEFLELKIRDRDMDILKYVSAINPFETYNSLKKLRENNNGVRLVISPIGPKPVMLGCVMYVLENENEMLLFDNPYQEGSNTTECGVSHFYDMTYFIRSVKNKRFEDEEE